MHGLERQFSGLMLKAPLSGESLYVVVLLGVYRGWFDFFTALFVACHIF